MDIKNVNQQTTNSDDLIKNLTKQFDEATQLTPDTTIYVQYILQHNPDIYEYTQNIVNRIIMAELINANPIATIRVPITPNEYNLLLRLSKYQNACDLSNTLLYLILSVVAPQYEITDKNTSNIYLKHR